MANSNAAGASDIAQSASRFPEEGQFYPVGAGLSRAANLLAVPRGAPPEDLVQAALQLSRAAGVLGRIPEMSQVAYDGGEASADLLEALSSLAAIAAGFLGALPICWPKEPSAAPEAKA